MIDTSAPDVSAMSLADINTDLPPGSGDIDAHAHGTEVLAGTFDVSVVSTWQEQADAGSGINRVVWRACYGGTPTCGANVVLHPAPDSFDSELRVPAAQGTLVFYESEYHSAAADGAGPAVNCLTVFCLAFGVAWPTTWI